MEAGVLAETRGRMEGEGGVVKEKLRPPGRDGERGSAEGAPERPKLGACGEAGRGSSRQGPCGPCGGPGVGQQGLPPRECLDKMETDRHQRCGAQ